MTTKMTNRDFFNAVLSADVSAELKEFAQGELNKMDARNAKRSSTQTQTQKENVAHKEKILSLLTATPQTAAELVPQVELSVQKVSALCGQLVKDGKAKVELVKVPKKGQQNAYSLLNPDEIPQA